MNIYTYAMEMELASEKNYRAIANSTNLSGLKKLFTMLADEEWRHYQMIQELQFNALHPEKLECNSLNEAEKLLEEVKSDFENYTGSHSAAYDHAATIEESAALFYENKSREIEDKYQSEIFLQLASEEHRHEKLLKELSEYVSFLDSGRKHRQTACK